MVFVVVVMVSVVVAAAVVVFAVVVVSFLPQSRLSLYSEGSRYEKQVVQLETYDLIGWWGYCPYSSFTTLYLLV